MKKLTDGALWSLCLEGNMEAFGELYERFYLLMYNYGCKLTPDSSIVYDVIQDLFTDLITNYRKISSANNSAGYLLAAIRNRLYNQSKVSQRYFSISDLEHLLEIADNSSLKEPDEYKKAIIISYRKLSAEQQEIIYLYYVQNLSHQQIAAILDINYQSSKNRLSRSIAILRKYTLTELKKDQ